MLGGVVDPGDNPQMSIGSTPTEYIRVKAFIICSLVLASFLIVFFALFKIFLHIGSLLLGISAAQLLTMPRHLFCWLANVCTVPVT
jgi:hypothetical protein